MNMSLGFAKTVSGPAFMINVNPLCDSGHKDIHTNRQGLFSDS